MSFRRKGQRAVSRVLAVVALATTTIAVTGGAASAAEEGIPPVVTLTASEYVTGSGNIVELSASAIGNEPGFTLEIMDVLGGTLRSCGSNPSCSTWVSESSGSRTFIARIMRYGTTLPVQERSASNTVTVYWHAASVVTLTATPPTTTVKTSIRLDATTDDLVNDGYLTIWEVTNPAAPTVVQTCAGASCSVNVIRMDAGTRDFVAHQTDGWNVNYFYWHNATSPVVRATWVNEPGGAPSASSLCDDGQQIVESTTQGYKVKMYTKQATADRTDVCVRVEDTTGRGFGGQFAITAGVPNPSVTNVQQPSQDDQSGACTATTPNGVPGSHPISAGGVGGQQYLVDAYSTSGQAWICLKAGSTNVRLKVPVAVPNVTVTPVPQVTFTPDAGTPDVI